MFPFFLIFDGRNMRGANTIYFANLSCAKDRSSNFNDINIRKLSDLIWSEHSWPRFGSSTLVHIFHILFGRAHSQMRWIDTFGIVARMKNKHPFWDTYFIMKFPRISMGISSWSFAAAINSISSIGRTGPFPAFMKWNNGYFFPKLNFIHIKNLSQPPCKGIHIG